jgi:hypothetical protein
MALNGTIWQHLRVYARLSISVHRRGVKVRGRARNDRGIAESASPLETELARRIRAVNGAPPRRPIPRFSARGAGFQYQRFFGTHRSQTSFLYITT